MAASIKISELNSLTNLTDVDLFLVSDMETGTSRKISYNNLKSNIITETSSALTDLEGVVAQNREDAESLVETVRAALQTAIDGNATSFNAGDTALSDRLDVLEADPVTKTYVDNTVDAVNQSLTISLGSLSDSVTTNTTDIAALQTSVDNLDIDIAPETLNSINELAGALGDDPQIITNLQAELTAYKAHIEDRNLQLVLAYDTPLYVDTLLGG
jgi:hypothetical protein